MLRTGLLPDRQVLVGRDGGEPLFDSAGPGDFDGVDGGVGSEAEGQAEFALGTIAGADVDGLHLASAGGG